MNWICIGVAALAALCLYLASPHQALWPAAQARGKLLRWLSLPVFAGSAASAVRPYGGWCGLCISLAGLMAVLVLLPYLDAWLHGARPRHAGARHVG